MKPHIPREVFLNDDLNNLPPLTRLLFIGLLSLADDDGLLEDRPRRIKALTLPYDDVDVDDMLDHLVQVGLIDRERNHTSVDAPGVAMYIAIEHWATRWLMPEPISREDDDEHAGDAGDEA